MTTESGGAKDSERKEESNEADYLASIIGRIRDALPLLSGELRAERFLHLSLEITKSSSMARQCCFRETNYSSCAIQRTLH